MDKIKTFLNQSQWALRYGLLRLLGSTLLVVFSETLYRKSLVNTLLWMVHSPLLALMNIAVIFSLYMLIGLMTRSDKCAITLTTILTVILALVNAGKLSLRNVPLTLSDLTLGKEIWRIRKQVFDFKMIIGIVIAIAVLGVFVFMIRRYQFKGKSPWRSGYALLLILGLFPLVIGQNFYYRDISIEKSGFFYSLSSVTRPLSSTQITEELKKEAKSNVAKLVNQYTGQDVLDTKDQVKPNVIIIQSEAFWDVNKLGVEFTENPISFYEAWEKESTHGKLYVPVVGGGTSNTEYEILTGMTLKNYSDDWEMVFNSSIKSPQPSMASIFRLNGYQSIGFHPFEASYYRRNEVYPYLGFNQFIALDDLGETPKYGSFTTDDYVTDYIIHLIETTEEPLFNYAVTVQNHGPYGDARFTPEERRVSLVTPMTDSSTYLLNNYIQGLYYSDKSLERLINYLKTSDEPTLVVFFGDHLPMLGADFQIYRESGYIGNESMAQLQEDQRIMDVDYVMWSNYNNRVEETSPINASFLTPRILERVGIELPDYLKAVKGLSEEMPIYMRSYYYDETGKKIDKIQPEYQLYAQMYRVIRENYYLENEQRAEWSINETVSAR